MVYEIKYSCKNKKTGIHVTNYTLMKIPSNEKVAKYCFNTCKKSLIRCTVLSEDEFNIQNKSYGAEIWNDNYRYTIYMITSNKESNDDFIELSLPYKNESVNSSYLTIALLMAENNLTSYLLEHLEDFKMHSLFYTYYKIPISNIISLIN